MDAEVLKKELLSISEGYTTPDKNKAFIITVLPFFNFILNGVFFSLNVFPNTIGLEEYNDLKQEMYYKLLDCFSDPVKIEKMKDVKAYAFITIRNRTLNHLRNNKRFNDFKIFCAEVGAKCKNDLITD